MSGFLTNVDFIIPIDLGFWGICPGCEGMSFLDPLDSIRGHMVVIFWTEVSSLGNFSMYAWKSLSWLKCSFRVFDIASLHMSTGIMEGSCGISSYVIWVGDGGGGVDTRSTMFSVVEVFVLFTFFG